MKYWPLIFISLFIASSYAEEESPWLITPTASVDPKLGASIGFVFGYLYHLDPKSDRSLTATSANWTDTQSQTQAIFSRNYFDANSQKLLFAAFHAKVNNDYENFLNSEQEGKTEDNITGGGFRYLHRVIDDWYLGINTFKMKYTITADDQQTQDIMDAVGLEDQTNSVGAGLMIEYDSRDNPNSPLKGTQFNIVQIANREALGSDNNYDSYRLNYKYFVSNKAESVLATQVKGRWVSDDTPQGAWSSVLLSGYIRGEYLAPNYISAETEGRVHISERWLWTAGVGVGCLYDETSDCNDDKNIYPAATLGVQFVLKVQDRLVVRAQYAQGKDQNQGFYIQFGQTF